MDKLAFPQIALLEQNLRITASRSFRESATRNASLIQLSKNFFSAPGGVSRRDRDAEGIPLSLKNKKPGVERRAPPSSHLGTALRDARLRSIRYS